MKNKFWVLCITCVFVFLFSGCASTTCTTDPSSSGYGCSTIREAEITRQQSVSVQLEESLQTVKSELTRSESTLKDFSERLSATKFSSSKTKQQASLLASELNQKAIELSQKRDKLVQLEEKVEQLKTRKMGKNESLVRIAKVEEQLVQTKSEIKVLTDFLQNDLFIKAENALLYN